MKEIVSGFEYICICSGRVLLYLKCFFDLKKREKEYSKDAHWRAECSSLERTSLEVSGSRNE